MPMAFLASNALLAPFPATQQARSKNGGAHSERALRFRRAHCPKRSRAGVSMMAKFQQRDDPAKRLDENSAIDSVVPPVRLPTLRSLSNVGPPLVIEEEPTDDAKAEENLRDMSRMGASMSAEQELNVINFLKSVAVEFGEIEWPPASRVFKITVIILVSIVVASAVIYVVDGFFYTMAQLLFETST